MTIELWCGIVITGTVVGRTQAGTITGEVGKAVTGGTGRVEMIVGTVGIVIM